MRKRDWRDLRCCGPDDDVGGRVEAAGRRNSIWVLKRVREENVRRRIPFRPVCDGPVQQSGHGEKMFGWTARAEKIIQK